MNKYSITEIMEMAVQTERIGGKFYTTMAEKFKSDGGLNKLFTTLAAKEKAHEKTFTELQEMVAKHGPEPANWDEVTNYLSAFAESEFFLGATKSLPSLERVKTVKDAVTFALGFEKETLLYYLGLRPLVKEKEVMDEVINEEKSHIVWLQKFKTDLTK